MPARRLCMTIDPIGNCHLLLIEIQACTCQARNEPVSFGQQNNRFPMEGLFAVINQGAQNRIQVGSSRQVPAEIVQLGGFSFALLGRLGLFPGTDRQLADHQANEEQGNECNHILRVGNPEIEIRQDEEKIKCQHAQDGGKNGRATAKVDRCDDNDQQVNHHQVRGLEPSHK